MLVNVSNQTPQTKVMIHKKENAHVPSFGKIHRTWAPQLWLRKDQGLVNIDVDGRKTAAGRVSANSAVHVVVGYIVKVGSRMGIGNAHCTVVASCGFMWLPHLPGHLS